MENSKINIFKNIDTSELSSLGSTEKHSPEQSNGLNVDKEFSQTNNHTKQTLNSEDNTEKGENTDNNSTDSQDTGSNKKTGKSLGKILPGKTALILINKMIPSLLVLSLYYMNLHLDKKRLSLEKDEINDLAPFVQDCLDSIELDFDNPWIGLGVALGIAYGSKNY